MFPATTASNAPLTMMQNRGSLSITRGGHTAGAIPGSQGLRSTTLTLTTGGDTGKTVVYTDHETSRPLLAHFGTSRDPNDMTWFLLGTTPANNPVQLPATIPHFTTPPPINTLWRINHTAAGSVTDVTTDTDMDGTTDAIQNNTRIAASFTGFLYGLPGQFRCTGGTNCQVQVVPAYAAAATNNQFPLQTLAITATGGGTLRFRPNPGATLQLYNGGPVPPDAEYMVFGYWREDPVNAAGVYQFNRFAQVFGGAATFPANVTATYDGVAVGAYVEHDPNDPVDTFRQGEFTADVFLSAAVGNVSGTIDDFLTTPTGGSAAPTTAARWVLTLNQITTPGTPGTVALNLAGGGAATEGGWTAAFVPHHANDANATTTGPPAVTGVFDARINNVNLNSVHLTGAYGAEVR